MNLNDKFWAAYKFSSYLKIFMLREGEGKSPQLLTKFSAAYKLFFLLTNFSLCVEILKLFQKFQGRGWTSPPTVLLTNSLAADKFSHSVHSEAWFHAFNLLFFWLVGQVHQGIDPSGPKSETEGLTILPCRLEDEVISCTYIWYFRST